MLNQSTPLTYLKTEGATITPNGALFKTDSEGFLPKLLGKMYNDRVKFKKKMLERKKNIIKQKILNYKMKLLVVIIYNGQRRLP